MKKHEQLSDLKAIKSVSKSLVLAMQKNFVAHEHMMELKRNLRKAISENKAKKAKLRKLKASLADITIERDQLAEQLNKADEDKKKAVETRKTRYLAELKRHRDNHRAELKEKVGEVEDRGFAEGKKAYEHQV
ncbi:uncharacterized protein LOC114272141 isoform X2 [Camellia sinensis]|uniref:uncharacterized protein LOC114272141 isoform X2 n=1 Tax=Camellia sinensis TaxID=4442 RepID=UPI0010359D55|nr:uncharacterized protein LOC114272141 isoform X2 [Camellia sinensis]